MALRPLVRDDHLRSWCRQKRGAWGLSPGALSDSWRLGKRGGTRTNTEKQRPWGRKEPRNTQHSVSEGAE